MGRISEMTAAFATPLHEPQPCRAALPALRAGPRCDHAAFAALRRRAVLHGCKWDPQVGDIETLAPFPLLLRRSVWRQLADWAERLTSEAMAAEEEILQRPELLRLLGLPRALRQVLGARQPLTPAAGRVLRFDFHPTTGGWRISEANSDVPGGFGEASHFTSLMAGHYSGLQPAGDTAAVWSNALSDAAGPGGLIALLSAPGYMEDHQVTAFLAARLRERGCRPHLAGPQQLVWTDGIAHLHSAWHCGRVDAVVRFYQAEWLARLPQRSGWGCFFRGGRTPVANPGCAVISESKRFPLLWDHLATPLPGWRALLPETRDPRRAPWEHGEDWLLKTAMCNTGDAVCHRAWLPPRDWARTRFAARWFPGGWVAQRRFESLPVDTPLGPRHACVGVYTVNGRAAGAYARLAVKPVIDFAAVDAALLVEDDD
jgi:hypothetical protein